MRVVIEADGVAPAPLHYSQAIRADDWIFVSGQLASDFHSPIAPEAQGRGALPFHSSPVKLQSKYLFGAMARLLEAGGSSLDGIVRIDQFSPSYDFMDPYLAIRNDLLRTARPASTALQIESLMVSEALVQADAIAIVPTGPMRKTPLTTDAVSTPPAGYSLAIAAGGLIFASGATPTDYRSGAGWPAGLGTGVAEEARVDPNFWFGSEIKKQTTYVVRKLEKYLAAGSATLKDIVKAQVYLAHMSDHQAFQEAWRDLMHPHMPAITVVPVKGMSTVGGRVEINLVAADPALRRTAVRADRAALSLCGEPHAIRAGNLLFISSQMACGPDGLAPEATQAKGLRYVSSFATRQMEVILRNTQAICEAAGTTLDNIVRAQLFYRDLNDLYPSMQVWKAAFPAAPPAATMVQVHDVLPVPECTILADFIAWIPT
jgi:enamine deaminase RidA (YjgF/YER057c/UK114 family)